MQRQRRRTKNTVFLYSTTNALAAHPFACAICAGQAIEQAAKRSWSGRCARKCRALGRGHTAITSALPSNASPSGESVGVTAAALAGNAGVAHARSPWRHAADELKPTDPWPQDEIDVCARGAFPAMALTVTARGMPAVDAGREKPLWAAALAGTSPEHERCAAWNEKAPDPRESGASNW